MLFNGPHILHPAANLIIDTLSPNFSDISISNNAILSAPFPLLLFGSYARGTANSASDIDLIALLPSTTHSNITLLNCWIADTLCLSNYSLIYIPSHSWSDEFRRYHATSRLLHSIPLFFDCKEFINLQTSLSSELSTVGISGLISLFDRDASIRRPLQYDMYPLKYQPGGLIDIEFVNLVVFISHELGIPPDWHSDLLVCLGKHKTIIYDGLSLPPHEQRLLFLAGRYSETLSHIRSIKDTIVSRMLSFIH